MGKNKRVCPLMTSPLLQRCQHFQTGYDGMVSYKQFHLAALDILSETFIAP